MDNKNIELVKNNSDGGPDVLVMKFADSKVPVFKEARGKDYIKYGEDNLYPEYLTYLFNKSAKHNAIVTGKASYIFGGGYENGNQIANRNNDSINDIAKKALIDIELYGGFRLEVIWDFKGRITEIYHADYNSFRKAKGGGFYYKECWLPSVYPQTQEEFIPAFNPSEPYGSQIYSYDEYRPGVRFYPLPGYIGSNNYIETDIEISKYYLSAIRNGMMPSKMVQFFTGEPTDEKKKQIEQRLEKKFAGAENAGKFFLVFNAANAQNKVEVSDLSANELDKHMIELNKVCQQEIFSGHLVTSPSLFGIKTEGQLGSTQEMKTAYEIFINTYAKPKAQAFDREFNWLMSFSNAPGNYELKSTDPIGLQFDVKDVINSLPKQFVFEKMGIPKDMWELPSIGSDSNPQVAAPTLDSDIPNISVNEHLKNLTGRQKQNILSIITKYRSGKMEVEMAKILLQGGYGFTDDDINNLLGIEAPAAMAKAITPEEAIEVFDEFGEDLRDYEIVKSKKVFFNEASAEDDEEVFIQAAFKSFKVTESEQQILDALKKNSKLTTTEIARLIKVTEAYVTRKIQSLIKEGYLEGEIGALIVPPEIIDAAKLVVRNPVQIYVKYSYEWRPEIPSSERNTPNHPSRPFCVKLMSLNRLYSRKDIEKISQRLGYSVFDRQGGFWRNGGNTEAHCRHIWKSNIVIKKGDNK